MEQATRAGRHREDPGVDDAGRRRARGPLGSSEPRPGLADCRGRGRARLEVCSHGPRPGTKRGTTGRDRHAVLAPRVPLLHQAPAWTAPGRDLRPGGEHLGGAGRGRRGQSARGWERDRPDAGRRRPVPREPLHPCRSRSHHELSPRAHRASPRTAGWLLAFPPRPSWVPGARRHPQSAEHPGTRTLRAPRPGRPLLPGRTSR